MASIGNVAVPVMLDAVPAAPPDRFHVISQTGMADQSVLFSPDRWDPVTLRGLFTSGSLSGIDQVVAAMRAQRRKQIDVDDGLRVTRKTVCCGFSFGDPVQCVIVGGTSPSDTWECEFSVTILPSPSVA